MGNSFVGIEIFAKNLTGHLSRQELLGCINVELKNLKTGHFITFEIFGPNQT